MKRTWAVLGAVLMAGCFGTETGNPPSVAMGLTARSSDPQAVSVDPTGSGIRIEAAWVALADLRTIEGAACDRVAASAAIERAVGDAVAGLELGHIGEGSSCGVHASLEPVTELPPGAPPSLSGRTVLVLGTLPDGRPFELSTELALGIRVQGAPFTSHTGDALLLAIDLAAWLRDLDLASVTPDADGTIRVGPDNPGALLTAFDANVALGFALFSDPDADGVLDADEEAAGPLAASH